MEKGNEQIEKALELIDKEYKNKALRKHFNKILHLFLPLDIDMQAIEILLKENKNKEAGKYLEDMLKKSGNYHEGILSKVEELLKQITDNEKRKKVKSLFDGKNDFFTKLKPAQIKEEFFNSTQNNKLKKEIESFHKWYEDLAKALRTL